MKRALGLLTVAAALVMALPACALDSSGGPRIVVPAHDIERDEVITDADLVLQTIPPERMRPGIAMASTNLVGREARRLLRAGEPVRTEDVRMPVLVTKGSAVTMIYSVPGITLTATGRAMTEGGMGETVIVQNPNSLRQVSGVVTGPGEVRAGDASNIASTEVAVNP